MENKATKTFHTVPCAAKRFLACSLVFALCWCGENIQQLNTCCDFLSGSYKNVLFQFSTLYMHIRMEEAAANCGKK